MADTGDGAGSQTIRIFLRARPVAKPSELVEVYEEDNKVEITVPKDTSGGCEVCSLHTLIAGSISPGFQAKAGYAAHRAVNNQQECFIFRFDGVLPPASTQDEVSLAPGFRHHLLSLAGCCFRQPFALCLTLYPCTVAGDS